MGLLFFNTHSRDVPLFKRVHIVAKRVCLSASGTRYQPTTGPISVKFCIGGLVRNSVENCKLLKNRAKMWENLHATPGHLLKLKLFGLNWFRK